MEQLKSVPSRRVFKAARPPLSHLHVIEDEEQRLCGESLEEFTAVHVWWRVLAVMRLSWIGVPLKVVPTSESAIKYNLSE